jgi:hypothetical protein
MGSLESTISAEFYEGSAVKLSVQDRIVLVSQGAIQRNRMPSSSSASPTLAARRSGRRSELCASVERLVIRTDASAKTGIRACRQETG